mmetsp:Transcript_20846/g.34884  ORF Transcript_20846/g.34884 Transcript_20846/m.34884 type:complete len:201 (-) Transcript_20846:858-1460(-)
MLKEEPKEALKESWSRQMGALAGQPQYSSPVALSRAPKITFVEDAFAERRPEQTPLASTAVATAFESTRETLSSAAAARNTTMEELTKEALAATVATRTATSLACSSSWITSSLWKAIVRLSYNSSFSDSLCRCHSCPTLYSATALERLCNLRSCDSFTTSARSRTAPLTFRKLSAWATISHSPSGTSAITTLIWPSRLA